MIKFRDITGKAFGRWTVMRFSHKTKFRETVWICRCCCGTERPVKASALISGKSGSCGCFHKENQKKVVENAINKKTRLPYGEAAFNSLFKRYKTGAEKRKLTFDISPEEFRDITKQNCYYCNQAPKTVAHYEGTNGDYVYNGVDRMNNNIGYLKNNCLPCCYDCNELKGSSGYEEFIEKIHRISENLKNK